MSLVSCSAATLISFCASQIKSSVILLFIPLQLNCRMFSLYLFSGAGVGGGGGGVGGHGGGGAGLRGGGVVGWVC